MDSLTVENKRRASVSGAGVKPDDGDAPLELRWGSTFLYIMADKSARLARTGWRVKRDTNTVFRYIAFNCLPGAGYYDGCWGRIKFGFTSDLKTRLNANRRTYGPVCGNLEYKHLWLVSPKRPVRELEFECLKLLRWTEWKWWISLPSNRQNTLELLRRAPRYGGNTQGEVFNLLPMAAMLIVEQLLADCRSISYFSPDMDCVKQWAGIQDI